MLGDLDQTPKYFEDNVAEVGEYVVDSESE